MNQDSDIKKLVCEMHSEQELLYLYFGETPKLKTRLLCARCILGIVNTVDIPKPSLLFLKDFLINPSNQLMKISRINNSLNQGNESEIIDKIESLLEKFEDNVKKQVEMIKQNLTQLKTQLGKIGTEINNHFKLNNLIEQFRLLGKMDSYQGTNELAKLEEQLNDISENLNKIYSGAKETVKDNQTLILNNFQNNFKIIQNECDSVSKTSLELLQNIVSLGMPKILLDDLGQFPQIHQQISQGKDIQYQLLYQGSRDGLNCQQYWAKCNNQSHLLTIMTSKNGNRFGAYSPCKINSALGTYVQDPTMKSFLFQYNKKEIYKIKNQAHAVCCTQNCGPNFGYSCDISISGDFSNGYSSYLGETYDTSNFNIVDKINHFFEATTPQLQECKVYKVIF